MNRNDSPSAIARLVRHVLFALFALGVGCSPYDAGPVATFEGMWREMDAMYGLFAVRGVDWDQIYATHRGRVHDAMSDDELHAVLTSCLRATDDGHVNLVAPDRRRWNANAIRDGLVGFERFDLDLVRRVYLGGAFETDAWEGYTLGALPDGTPYLHLPYVSSNLAILRRARTMAEAAGTLVLDLRHNDGGDFTWAFSELDRWTSTRRPVFRSRTRNGPARSSFTGWHEWALRGGGDDVTFRIVVLIDRFTISAGERMTLALATLDDVLFVGETTNGSLSTTIGRELPNGWVMSISTQEIFEPTGDTTYEGVGIAPDLEVVNDPIEMAAGMDAALDEAMANARTRPAL